MNKSALDPLDFMPEALVEEVLSSDPALQQQLLQVCVYARNQTPPSWPAATGSRRRELAIKLLKRADRDQTRKGLRFSELDVLLHEAALNLLTATQDALASPTPRQEREKLKKLAGNIHACREMFADLSVRSLIELERLRSRRAEEPIANLLDSMAEAQANLEAVARFIQSRYVSNSTLSLFEKWDGLPQLGQAREAAAIHHRLHGIDEKISASHEGKFVEIFCAIGEIAFGSDQSTEGARDYARRARDLAEIDRLDSQISIMKRDEEALRLDIEKYDLGECYRQALLQLGVDIRRLQDKVASARRTATGGADALKSPWLRSVSKGGGEIVGEDSESASAQSRARDE